MTRKTTCHNAAARIARPGTRRSTQHSLKKLPSRKFLGTRVQVRTPAMLLKIPWWKEPQATSSLGPSPVSRRTGVAAGLAAWPRRFNELLMGFRDIFPFVHTKRGGSLVLPLHAGLKPGAT